MRIFNWMKRKSPGEIILYSVVSLLFMVVALRYIYLLVWAFIAGCKTHLEVVMNPFALPKEWHFDHYIEVFKALNVNGNNFLDMFFNSVWYTVASTLLHQFCTMTFAYTCTKYDFPGKNIIYPIVLVVLTMPIYGNSGAVYELYLKLGFIDSYALVLNSLTGFSIYYLYYRAFFQNLSWTYAEAAMVDGANDFQIYFKVMLPQTKAMFGALFLMQWIGAWNSYESELIYLPNLPTLPVGIYQFNIEMIYSARLDILFAACVIITLPALILFIIFNKTITTNVSLGGIKG